MVDGEEAEADTTRKQMILKRKAKSDNETKKKINQN